MASVTYLSNGGVVGGTTVDPGDPFQYGHAATWYYGTVTSIHALLEPLGAVASDVQFVNSYGEAIGTWYDAAGYGHLYFFNGGDTVSAPDPLTEFIWSEDGRLTAINDNGVVAGFHTNEEGKHTLAYHWFGYGFDVATQTPEGSSLSYARGLNERNDTFGNAWNETFGGQDGFVVTYEDMTIREVASLGGDTCVHGMNNRGDVVGHSNGPGNVPYLGDERFTPGPNTLFSGGKVYDLNELIPPGSGFVLSSWTGKINDLGQILVGAWDANGIERAILLTPLPVSEVAFAGTPGASGWFASNATATLTANDAVTGVRDVHYRVDAGPWVTVAGSTATFTISQNGTHRVSYYAVDAKGHAEAVKDATVSINKGGVVILDRSLPDGTTGAPYSATLTAAGGVSPYTCRVTAGSVPAGLTLRTDCAIVGTPTLPSTSWFQVQATSKTGASSRSFLSIAVRDPLTITTPAHASGTASIGLTATGGRAPYAWSIDPATPLPAGMNLAHATIYGSVNQTIPPTNVTVIVTDAAGASASQSLTIDFLPPIVVTISGETTVQAGANVAIRVQTEGGAGGWYWHTFDPPLPEGLAWGGTYWDITTWGSIATPGTYTFGVQVSDSFGNLSEQQYVTLTVQ